MTDRAHDPEPVGLAEAAGAALAAVLERTGEDDLARPTPCAAWDVGDLLRHLDAVAESIAGLARTGVLVLDDAPGGVPVSTSDVIGRVGDSIAAIREAAAHAVDGERAQQAATAAAVEYATHGWDLATAVGAPSTLGDDDARAILELVRTALPDAARGDRFGPAVATARPDDEPGAGLPALAAFLGRRPDERGRPGGPAAYSATP